MKKIILKELRLVNFKSIKEFTFKPNEDFTSVCGRNGLGKSTLFDALTWTLFGKDSHSNTQFTIKTVDSEGNVIPKLPHEATVILDVDGQTIELRRCHTEKWTKKRSSAVEEFTGNQDEFFVNDVPCKKQEYQSKVSEICDEEIFKLITSPTAFTSLPWQKQRAMLFEMAGSVNDDELASGNKDFEELMEHLTNKSLEEYKKEISAKKKRVKTECETIPVRIDEVKRSIPETKDWAALEKEQTEQTNSIKELDDILSDLGKAQTSAHAAHDEILKQLSDVREKKQQVEFAIKTDVQKEYFAAARKRSEVNSQIGTVEDSIKAIKTGVAAHDEEIAKCDARREELIAEWRSIKAEKLNIDESLFECPTCHRSLEPEQIDATKVRMTEDFNKRQAARIADNTNRGKQNKERKEKLEVEKTQFTEKLAELESKLQELKSDTVFTTNSELPDAQPIIEANDEWKTLSAKEEALITESEKPITLPNDEERKRLREEKIQRESRLREINEELSIRNEIKKDNERIAVLEEELKTNSQELADLERIEFVAQQFSKARIDAVSDKINAMFSMVRWSLFEEYISGGEKETCVATVNGVPFDDVNAANKILAGLDIVKTVSKYFQTSSMVFLDNAERIDHEVRIDDMQIIELRVTTDEKLTIK